MVDRPAFAVRAPTPDDAAAMAEVHNTGWRETYHQLPPRFYDDAALERRRQTWHRTLTEPRPGRTVRVGAVAGSVVGIAMSGPPLSGHPVRDLELYALYVLAAHHGTGVGQALLDAVLGEEPAQLWVAEDNPRARAFYARNGFRPDGARKVDAGLDDLAEVRLVR
ncbi:GNAT family N-acetyltransferase [Georgenia alba]|uniref:GNAT family N-acetyltransferase n=1 Tax=Georgenia alba TaxID=2233858 RepID=A0ABW2Q7X2_9MICO